MIYTLYLVVIELGKWLSHSLPQFPQLKKYVTLMEFVKIKWDKVSEELKMAPGI